MTSVFLRLLSGAFLLVTTSFANAHTGHGTSGVVSGLFHPFGIDHLLAMVAVGVWSVSALSKKNTWWGPAVFMSALILGAAMGALRVSISYLEFLISISVVVFGLMLVISRIQLPVSVGLTAIALAGTLHGLAHGAESPESGFASYAIGFLVTTAILHMGGIVLGLAIRSHFKNNAPVAVQLLGIGCGSAGLFLLTQM